MIAGHKVMMNPLPIGSSNLSQPPEHRQWSTLPLCKIVPMGHWSGMLLSYFKKRSSKRRMDSIAQVIAPNGIFEQVMVRTPEAPIF